MTQHLFTDMKKIIMLAIFLSCAAGSFGQDILKSLQSNKPGQGKVVIHQSKAISDLISRPSAEAGGTSSPSAKTTAKTVGYRVMLYAGNNSRASRTEAENIAKQVKEMFPDMPVYARFASPRWLCQLGDFRNIEEADAWMRKIKATGKFKEMSIVKEQINIQF